MSTFPRPVTYSYATERHVLDTDAGQRAVYEALLDAEHLAKANDSFGPLAVIDRLIETGYLARADMGIDAAPCHARIYRWIARSRS